MQRIGGDEHAGEAEFRDQPRHGGNLAGRRRDLQVRQDQRSVAGKRAQHVGGRLTCRWSKLPRSVLPSSATVRQPAALIRWSR
jgi:hypothetical protein